MGPTNNSAQSSSIGRIAQNFIDAVSQKIENVKTAIANFTFVSKSKTKDQVEKSNVESKSGATPHIADHDALKDETGEAKTAMVKDNYNKQMRNLGVDIGNMDPNDLFRGMWSEPEKSEVDIPKDLEKSAVNTTIPQRGISDQKELDGLLLEIETTTKFSFNEKTASSNDPEVAKSAAKDVIDQLKSKSEPVIANLKKDMKTLQSMKTPENETQINRLIELKGNVINDLRLLSSLNLNKSGDHEVNYQKMYMGNIDKAANEITHLEKEVNFRK